MSDLLTALRLEVESLGRRAGSGTSGDRGRAATRGTREYYETTLARIGATGLGRRAGATTRAFTAMLADLPVLTATADTVACLHSIDLLADDVRADPRDHRRLVQLAEAIAAADRDRRFLRALTGVVNPSSVLVSGGLRAGRRLDDDRPLPHLRLARAACRATDRADDAAPGTELSRSRAYRLCGKPGLGVRHAERAVELARLGILDARDGADREEPSGIGRWAVVRGIERGRRYVASRSGDYSVLDDEDRARRVAGAAWTSLALSLADRGNPASTAAAGHAVALGFTFGHRVLASTTEPDGGFAERVEARRAILAGIATIDRVYWAGHHRGGVRTTGATTVRQAGKAGRVVVRSGSFVARRLRT